MGRSYKLVGAGEGGVEGAGSLILGNGAMGVNALAAEAFAQTIREARAGASRYWPTLARLDGVALDMPAIRERIFAVYSSRCPDKLKGLAKLLAKYSGREYRFRNTLVYNLDQ